MLRFITKCIVQNENSFSRLETTILRRRFLHIFFLLRSFCLSNLFRKAARATTNNLAYIKKTRTYHHHHMREPMRKPSMLRLTQIFYFL